MLPAVKESDDSSSTPRGRPLSLDESAASASPALPAFLARPEGTPVYHGFSTLDGVEVDGFGLGMITNFLVSSGTVGDAFVIAPDGSRAGLVWESETEHRYFEEVSPPEEGRWGVWAVGLPQPLNTVEDAQTYLEQLIPDLRREWENWRDSN